MLEPIPTVYQGYSFRSRLEARWAVFFDCLGLKWVYEPEGYALGPQTGYLPDFRVDGLGFLEIKPFPEADDGKLERLILGSGVPDLRGYLIAGMVPAPEEFGNDLIAAVPDSVQITIYATGKDGLGWADYGYQWCYCERCGRVGIEFEGRWPRICRHDGPPDDRGYNSPAARLRVAAMAARQADFGR